MQDEYASQYTNSVKHTTQYKYTSQQGQAASPIITPHPYPDLTTSSPLLLALTSRTSPSPQSQHVTNTSPLLISLIHTTPSSDTEATSVLSTIQTPHTSIDILTTSTSSNQEKHILTTEHEHYTTSSLSETSTAVLTTTQTPPFTRSLTAVSSSAEKHILKTKPHVDYTTSSLLENSNSQDFLSNTEHTLTLTKKFLQTTDGRELLVIIFEILAWVLHEL